MRKVIQLSATTYTPSLDDGGLRDTRQGLVVAALCDDGSAWLIHPDQLNSRWTNLPQIPQGELLEHWLVEVSRCLVRNYLVRRDVIDRVVKENRARLEARHESGVDADVAAHELTEHLKQAENRT